MGALLISVNKIRNSVNNKAVIEVTNDLNSINISGFYTGWDNPKGAPTNQNGIHWHVIHCQFNSSWKYQMAMNFGSTYIFKRNMFNGVWKEWS